MPSSRYILSVSRENYERSQLSLIFHVQIVPRRDPLGKYIKPTQQSERKIFVSPEGRNNNVRNNARRLFVHNTSDGCNFFIHYFFLFFFFRMIRELREISWEKIVIPSISLLKFPWDAGRSRPLAAQAQFLSKVLPRGNPFLDVIRNWLTDTRSRS